MLAARRLEGELDQSVLQTGAAALGGVLTPPAVRVPVRPPRAHACHAARPSPMSPRPGVRGGAAQAVRELVGGADCREAPCAQRSPAAVALTTRHPPQPRARCRRVADELRATLAAREAEIGDLRRGIEQARRRTQFAASPQTFLIDKIEAAEGGAREAEARAAAAAQVRGVEGPIATLDGGVRAALGVCVGGGRPQGRARRGARAAEAPAGRPRAAAAAARLDRLAPHHARATSVRGKDTRGLDGWPVFLIQSEAEGHSHTGSEGAVHLLDHPLSPHTRHYSAAVEASRSSVRSAYGRCVRSRRPRVRGCVRGAGRSRGCRLIGPFVGANRVRAWPGQRAARQPTKGHV